MIVTFLTSTYNRAYILGQLYASLSRQTKKKFEWIIIDDGSTDNTADTIRKWREEASFPILYQYQENGGKHRALNRGVWMASAPYICVIDSDDYLVDNSVELIQSWTQQIRGEAKFAGVAGVRKTPNGQLLGDYPIGKRFVDATDIQRREKCLEGDKAEVYRTGILRQYPFPEFTDEKFLSECAVWNKIAIDGYYLRWFPEALCICEYRQDGLTFTADKEKNNYQGYTYVIKQQLQYESLRKQLALIAQYDGITKQRGGTSKDTCDNLQITRLKLVVARSGKRVYEWLKQLR